MRTALLLRLAVLRVRKRPPELLGAFSQSDFGENLKGQESASKTATKKVGL